MPPPRNEEKISGDKLELPQSFPSQLQHQLRKGAVKQFQHLANVTLYFPRRKEQKVDYPGALTRTELQDFFLFLLLWGKAPVQAKQQLLNIFALIRCQKLLARDRGAEGSPPGRLLSSAMALLLVTVSPVKLVSGHGHHKNVPAASSGQSPGAKPELKLQR